MTLRDTIPSLCLLVACAAPPLGDDFASLDAAGQDSRAVEALRELFVARVDGAGRAVPSGLAVEAADPRGITWREDGDGPLSRLAWGDVVEVEHQVLMELPARPESLYLHLRPGSPSAASVQRGQRTPLGHAGLSGPYLHLPQRPARSRERLLAALQHLRGRALPAPASPAAPAAAVASTAPSASPPGGGARLEEAEALLKKLAAWREAGLITPEEHERERRRVLDGLAREPAPGGAGE